MNDERLEYTIRPVRHRSLGEEVYDTLAKLISIGELEAGKQLPSEGELCRLFGVSRPVVRNALARLRDESLIVSRKGSGSFVSPIAPGAIPDIDPQQQLSTMLDALEFRRSIEPDAAYYAALRRTPEDLEAIQTALENFRRADEQGDRQRVDFAFHMAIAKAAQNDHYIRGMHVISYDIDLGVTIARHLSRLGQSSRRQAIFTEHRQIVLGIEAEDPNVAREAMRQHLDHSQFRVLARGKELIRRATADD
ncbi:FadR/GntR family transcriptional regulator [Rhodospirillaceae bacterium SYSU D60014]|uniref:FadR/GntR family transcriptional regulator n=1 Tax=Virgifigura deserti TaxID=2268457 RepID=UPI000E666866